MHRRLGFLKLQIMCQIFNFVDNLLSPWLDAKMRLKYKLLDFGTLYICFEFSMYISHMPDQFGGFSVWGE